MNRPCNTGQRTQEEVTKSEVSRAGIEDSPQQSDSRQGFKLASAVAGLTVAGLVGAGAGSMASAAGPTAPDSSQLRLCDAHRSSHEHTGPRRLSPESRPQLDRTGRKRFGKASFYAPMFAGRKMADGTRMRPGSNNAASRTLPLGTTAKVTNLETGKSAVVTIHDRGPYVVGRIVDLSPATAREIGLDRRAGVTRVEVAPIAIPMANGNIKLGDGISH